MTLDNLVVIVRCLKDSMEKAEQEEAKLDAEYRFKQKDSQYGDEELMEAFAQLIKAREWKRDIEAAMSAVRTHEWI